MKNIIVKAYNQAQNSQEVVVQTRDGEPTIIQAENFTNYEFVNEQTGFAPDHIITKRVGNDLHLSFEEDGQNTDLIIENFYSYDQALIGQAENGNYYYYVPDAGEIEFYVTELANNTSAGQALGGDPIASPLWIPVSAASFPWGALALLALPIGVLASVKDDDDNTPSTTPNPLKETLVTEYSETFGTNKSRKIDLTVNNPELKNASTFELIDPTDNQAKKIVTVAGVGTWTVTDVGQIEFAPAEALLNNKQQPPEITYLATIGERKVSSGAAVHISYPDNKLEVAGRDATEEVLNNDTDGKGAIVSGSIKLIHPVTGEEVTSVKLAGEGEWVVENDKITFKPEAGYVGKEQSIDYVAKVQRTVNGNTIVEPLQKTKYTVEYHHITGDKEIGELNKPVTVEILKNDDLTNGKTAKPETVQLFDPKDNQPKKTVTVEKEGEWKVNTNGTVTFTPEKDFTGNPSPINYTVEVTKDGSTLPMPPTPIAVIYPSLTQKDFKVGKEGEPTTINVVNNDYPVDTSTLKLVNPTTGAPEDSFVVANQGTWTVVRDPSGKATGEVTFTPVSGFKGNPSIQKYTVTLPDGQTSQPTNIEIVYDNNGTTLGDSKIAPVGSTVTVDVIANDGNVNSASLQLLNPQSGLPVPNGESISVPNEGTWKADPITGTVTFTPNVGFTDNPTPINYTINSKEGKTLPPTPVQVIYTDKGTPTPPPTNPPAVEKPVASLTGDDAVREPTGKAVYTVELDKEATEDTIITYQVTAGSASENADYVVLSQTVTIPKGQKSASFSVEIKNDKDPEANETYTVTLVSSNQATIKDDKKAVQTTIIDDDTSVVPPPADAPVVSLDGNHTVLEGNDEYVVHKVTLDKASNKDVTVDYIIKEGSASEGKDYSYNNYTGTVLFKAGETVKEIRVKVLNDRLNESNESYNVTLVNPSNTKLGKLSATATITDNDRSAVSKEVVEQVRENLGEFTFTDEVKSASINGVDISNASATNPVEVAGQYGKVIVTKFDPANKSFSYAYEGNYLDHSKGIYNDELTITQTTPDGKNYEYGMFIKVNDSAPVAQEDKATLSVKEDKSGVFSVTKALAGDLNVKTNDKGEGITIKPTTQNGLYGKVVINADGTYTYEFNQENAFFKQLQAGQTETKEESITYTVLDVDGSQTTATLKIAVTMEKEAITVTPPTPPVALPVVSLSGVEAVREDAGKAQYTVELDKEATEDVVVTYTVTAGTATAGQDYAVTSQSITIKKGEKSASFTVDIKEDTTVENSENYVVSINKPTNAELGKITSVTTSIVDNDNIVNPPPAEAPTVSLDGNKNALEGNDKEIVHKVRLDKAYTQDVSVDYEIKAGNASEGSDYSANTYKGTVLIKAGQTEADIVVNVLDDTADEPNETYTLTISNPTNAKLGSASAVATIRDNDFANLNREVVENTTQTLGEFSFSNVKSATILGTEITTATPAQPVEVAGTHGKILITGYNASTGTFTFSYASNGYKDHSDTAKTYEDEFVVKVTTANNEVHDRHIFIKTNDSVPTATADSATLAVKEDKTGTFAVTEALAGDLNVLTNDKGESIQVKPETLTGTYGTLTLNVNGTYTYDFNKENTFFKNLTKGGSAQRNDTFKYKVIDADGSETEGSLNVVVKMEKELDGGSTTPVNPPSAEPSVYLDGDKVIVEGNGDSVTHKVKLTQASTETVTVNYTITAGSASVGSDFNAVQTGTITFNPGETEKDIRVEILNDLIPEGDTPENYTVELSNAVKAKLGIKDKVETKIYDNDQPALNTEVVEALSGDNSLKSTPIYPNANFTSVKINGQDISQGTVTLTGKYGTWTISDYNPTTGQFKNSYLVNEGLDHNGKEYVEDFAVELVATDGTRYEQGISFKVTDSVPTATDLTGTVEIRNDGTNVNAPVLTGSVQATGIDGNIKFKPQTLTGKYGTISIDENGQYTYDVDENNAEVKALQQGSTLTDDTVEYEITDADGSVGKNKLTFVIKSIDNSTVTPPPPASEPVVTLSGDKEVNENAGKATYAVTLDKEASEDVVVTYTVIAGTATEGTDYVPATTKTVTIAKGQKSASFEVEIKEDTDVEGDETYTVAIVKPSNAQLGTSSVETTIKDNDTAVTPPPVAEPVVTLSGVKEVNENAGKATYTVTLDKEASEDVVVTYTVTAGTATEGADYVPATTKTVTIAKGQKSASFEVEIKEDTNTENDETYTVAIVKPSNAQLGTSSVETTIKDNDTAVTPPPSAPLKVALTGADRVHENVQKAQLIADKSNDNFVEYTVSLDGNAKAPAGGVEVEYTITLGTASDNDFVNLVKTGKVIIPEGQSSATFKVQIADDKEIEGASTFGAENYTVSIAKPANAEVVSGKTEVTTRILDNDHRPLETTVTAGVEQKLPNYPIVVPSSYNSAFMTVDTGFEAEHHIDLTKASPTNPVEVKGQHGTLIVKGYNAAGELDMYYTANGTQAVKETFTLKYHSITADREYHRDIIINVTDGAVPPPPPPPASTEPKISIEGLTSVYEDNGDKFVTYKVKLDKAPEAGKDVKVTYTVSSTSASNETDYAITPEIGILTFTGTETEKEIRVEIKGDLVKEERENFTVILSNPENATITTNSVRTEIVDNDLNPTNRSVPEMTTRELGTFGINNVNTITSNGSRDFKTATPANPIEVQGKFGKLIVTNYDPASGDVVYSYRSETDKDNTNGEKDVFIIEGKTADNIVFTKPIYIEITDGVVTPPPATVPVVSLEGEATVAEDGKSVTYKVKLDKAPASGQTVEVEYTILEGSAKLGSEFTTANGTLTDKLTFTGTETEKTFTVNITDDTVVDGDKNFKVYLSNLTNADYDNNRKEIETVIKDNDMALPPPALPEISIEGLTSVTEDAVTEVVYKVKLNKAPEAGQTVSVNYAVADGSALNGSDYEINPASGTLTFTGTETEKEIRVTIKGDTVQESAKTFSVTLSNIQNATLVGNSAVTTEILDNDLDSQNFSVVEGKNTETFTLSNLKASEYESITLGGEALQTGKTITTPKGVVTVVSYNDVSGEAVLSYESVSAFDHSGGTTHEDVIALTAVKNGVPLNANVTFNITDSEPKPQNDVANATVVKNGNDITLGAITGVLNVLDNDSVVADKKDAIKLTPHANIELGHGTLTLNGDGTYTYELSQRGKEKIAQMKNGEVFKDEYLYMVTDADNDTETASLTINFTVDDQTPAPKPQLTLTGSASVGEGQSAKYQLTVDQALTDDLIVSYEIVNGDGKRITNGTHTVTVPKTQAPNTPFEFDVAINNDGDVDGNHTYTLKVVSTNSPDVEINNDAKTGISTEIIEDDVVKVVVNLDQDQTVTEKAGEDVAVTHTFNLNKAHTEKVKVFFEITGDTNQIEAPANNFVEINAGDTSASITVKVKADKVDDPDHKYTINITNVENAEKGTTTPSITTTIHDNDEVLPAVAQTFTEGQTQSASFTDSRLIGTGLTVDNQAFNGTPLTITKDGHQLVINGFDEQTGKVDYSFTGKVIDNHGNPVKVASYSFEIVGADGKEYKKALDISVEDGELLVSAPQGTKLEFTRKGSTIQPAGTISGTLGMTQSDEVVEIKLDKPATFGTFTVTPDGKFTYDLDEANADLLKMENGKNTVETIELTVTDRDGTSKKVSFNIDLTAKVENALYEISFASNQPQNVYEGSPNIGATNNVTHKLELNEVPTEPVTVEYAITGAITKTGTVTFTGKTADIVVEVADDKVQENTETYTITLSNPSANAVLKTGAPVSINTNIIDNDASLNVTEGRTSSGSVTFPPSDYPKVIIGGKDITKEALPSEFTGTNGKLVITGYNPATGEVNFDYTANPTTHTDAQRNGTVALPNDSFVITLADATGTTSRTQDLNFNIQDSAPAKRDLDLNVNIIVENQTVNANELTGKLPAPTTTADTPVRFKADTQNTPYGDFKVDADGNITFTVDKNNFELQNFDYGENVAVETQYTTIDGDGSETVSTVKINIQNITLLEVDEDNPFAEKTTNPNQKLTYEANEFDKLQTLTYNGQDVKSASETNPIVVNGKYGTLTIKGFDDATKSIIYDYDTTVQNHNPVRGALTQDFNFISTDADGKQYLKKLWLENTDSSPTTESDKDTLDLSITNNVVSDAEITGKINILANDKMLDTPAKFLMNEVTNTYGKVVLNNDGTYKFTPDIDNAELKALQNGETKTIEFEVAYQDGDGSIGLSKLTIDLVGQVTNPPPPAQPFVALTANGTEFFEGSEIMTYTVTLHADAQMTQSYTATRTEPLTVAFDVKNISETLKLADGLVIGGGADAVAKTITIPVNSNSATFTVMRPDNEKVEGDGKFIVELKPSNDYGLANKAKVDDVTIRDDDLPVNVSYISISAVKPIVGEAEKEAEFIIKFDRPNNAETKVLYEVVATDDGGQMTVVQNQTVTVPALTKSVSLKLPILDTPAIGDGKYEVRIKPGDGKTGIKTKYPTTATITVIDNDASTPPPQPTKPFVSISQVGNSYTEGEEHIYTVKLTSDAEGKIPFDATESIMIPVTFANASGSNLDLSKLVKDGLIGGRVVISTGNSEATFVVTRTENTTIEPNGSYTVTLGKPANAELGNAKTITTELVDNDAPLPKITSIKAVTDTVDEASGKAEFDITIEGTVNQPITVTYETEEIIGGFNYLSADGTFTIPQGTSGTYRLSLPVTNDSINNNGGNHQIVLTKATNAQPIVGRDLETIVTITDDDVPNNFAPVPNAPNGETVLAPFDRLVESNDIKRNEDGTLIVNLIKGTNEQGAPIPTFVVADGDKDEGDKAKLFISHVLVNGVKKAVGETITLKDVGDLIIKRDGTAEFTPLNPDETSKTSVSYGNGTTEKIEYVVRDREGDAGKEAKMELRLEALVAHKTEHVNYSVNTTSIIAPGQEFNNIFEVKLDRPVSKNIILTLEVHEGTNANNNTDYTGIGTPITILAGQTSALVQVTTRNDNVANGDKRLVLKVNAQVEGTTGTKVIIDNQSTPPVLDILIKEDFTGLNERFNLGGLTPAESLAPIEGSGGNIIRPGTSTTLIKKLPGESVIITAPDGKEYTLQNGENRIETRTHTYPETPADVKDVMVFTYDEATGRISSKFTEGGYIHNNKQPDAKSRADMSSVLEYKFALYDADKKQLGGIQVVKTYVREDDSFKAEKDSFTVNLNEALAGKGISGNVLLNDNINSRDGDVTVKAAYHPNAQNALPGSFTFNNYHKNVGGTAIVGAFGTLTIQANGDYTYTPDPAKSPTLGTQDNFRYYIGDRDTNNSDTGTNARGEIVFTFADAPSAPGVSWTPGISAVETDTSLLNGQVDSVYFDASELAQRSVSDVFVILDPTDQVTLDDSFAIYGLINAGGEVFVQHAEPNGTVNLNIINGYNGQNFVVAEADTVGTTSLKDVLLLNSKLSALTFSDFEALELQNGQADEVEIDLDAILTSDKQENGVSVFTIRGEKGDVITALDGQNISETNEGEQINGYTKYEYQNNGQSAYLFIDNDINRDGLIG